MAALAWMLLLALACSTAIAGARPGPTAGAVLPGIAAATHAGDAADRDRQATDRAASTAFEPGAPGRGRTPAPPTLDPAFEAESCSETAWSPPPGTTPCGHRRAIRCAIASTASAARGLLPGLLPPAHAPPPGS